MSDPYVNPPGGPASGNAAAPSLPLLFAEDLKAGMVFDLGSYRVERVELVDFASQWDPQGFHTDDDVAAAGRFGEVIASGVHTLAVFQRLAVLGALQHWAIVAGRSIRDVQFVAPVLAGAVLRGQLTVAAVIPDKPGRSLVRMRGRLIVSDHEVMTLESDALVSRRRPS
jgi:acyl dehydratase